MNTNSEWKSENDLEESKIPWSFKEYETVFRFELAGFYTTTVNTEYFSKPWSTDIYL